MGGRNDGLGGNLDLRSRGEIGLWGGTRRAGGIGMGGICVVQLLYYPHPTLLDKYGVVNTVFVQQ